MSRRKNNICPSCEIAGDVVLKSKGEDEYGNKLVFTSQPEHWRCPKCKMQWDINEDFFCVGCGKPVKGRYIWCSKDCNAEWDSKN